MTKFDITRFADNNTGEGESITHPPEQIDDATNRVAKPSKLAKEITPDSFDQWYRDREYTNNIREGKPYFNGPGKIKAPSRHSPSSLLQCHRKIEYRQLNAPEENKDPNGIFWVGTKFEEEIALPYLDELFEDPDTYVTNSIWVDFTLECTDVSLRFKGVTDPVIVDSKGEPLLVTEIKTKRSVEHLEQPDRHHKAQAYTYMYGLSQKYNRAVSDTVILYGSRNSLNVKAFHVQFDSQFWNEVVVDWARTHSRYRTFGIQPPAEPEFDWECEHCSYKHRCGKSDKLYEDVGAVGLLPKHAGYPKEKVRDYLESHDDAKLTPTLAYEYPELAEQYDTYDWQCSGCEESFEWTVVKHDPNNPNGPTCPGCESRSLRGPDPQDQHLNPESD